MRIAHVNVARNYRGGERQTELLMRELKRFGIEQRLVTRHGSLLGERVSAFDIDVRQVSGQLPGVVLATRGADLVHVHEGRSIYAAWLRFLISGTPYIATRRVNNRIRDHRIAHRAYCSAAYVSAVAPQVADVVRTFDPAVRTTVILSSSSGFEPDAAEVRKIRQRFGGAFLIGHVGALDNDQKAQDVIISVASALCRSHSDIHFVLVGGGSDEELLRKLAAGLNNLTFTGFVDNVGDYLAAFDVFILPSRREGIGSILFDAMAQSLPLIVTPVGGIPSIVLEGENGVLIDVDDADQLRDAIIRLRDNPELRARLGENGRRMALTHTPPQMAHSYLELYRAVLDSA